MYLPTQGLYSWHWTYLREVDRRVPACEVCKLEHEHAAVRSARIFVICTQPSKEAWPSMKSDDRGLIDNAQEFA
jgi:hypothetical protein